MITRLNLGCGHDHRDGFVNADIRGEVDPDIVVDLNDIPWPWDDDSVNNTVMIDTLEHLDDVVAVMDELHRITMDDGVVTIRVPHYEDENAYIDPTHQHLFAPDSIRFFLRDAPDPYERYTDKRWQLINQRWLGDRGENIEWSLTPVKEDNNERR